MSFSWTTGGFRGMASRKGLPTIGQAPLFVLSSARDSRLRPSRRRGVDNGPRFPRSNSQRSEPPACVGNCPRLGGPPQSDVKYFAPHSRVALQACVHRDEGVEVVDAVHLDVVTRVEDQRDIRPGAPSRERP